MLRFKSLGSGSAGNATVVEAGSGASRVRLLVDSGFALRQLDERLARAELDPDQIDAIFVTHEHSDHIGCASQFALRQRIPLWMSRGTYAAIGEPELGGLLRIANDAASIEIGDLHVIPFTVPHDAREPLQLRCTDGVATLGVLTDLGHASTHVLEQLEGCGSLLLECNHDPALLAASNYPPFLKQRVGGPYGHLANEQAAAIVAALRPHGLRQVVAGHLSERNNKPALAREALALALGIACNDVCAADAASGCAWITA